MPTSAELMTRYRPVRCRLSPIDGTVGIESGVVLILAREVEKDGEYRLLGVLSAAHAGAVAANWLSCAGGNRDLYAGRWVKPPPTRRVNFEVQH